MRILSRLTAAGGLAAALLAVPVPAAAEVTIHFTTGSQQAGKGHHRRQHGIQRHRFGARQHSGNRGRFGSHQRSPRRHRFQSREIHRHDAWKNFPYSKSYGRGHRQGHRHAPPKAAFGRGCRLVTERSHDVHGRLIILQRTLCYDRFGKPYLLGSH